MDDRIKGIAAACLAAIQTRFECKKAPCPRLSALAELATAAGYAAEVDHSFCSTDTHYKGSRLRRPGLGREGNKLVLFDDSKRQLFSHNSAETYRKNVEVAEWLQNVGALEVILSDGKPEPTQKDLSYTDAVRFIEQSGFQAKEIVLFEPALKRLAVFPAGAPTERNSPTAIFTFVTADVWSAKTANRLRFQKLASEISPPTLSGKSNSGPVASVSQSLGGR